MTFSFKSSKYLLIALNLLYLVVSFILVGVAAYARLSIYVTSVHIVGGIIACGVFLFVLAVVGILGAIRHSQAILFFFSVACACLSIPSDYQQILVETTWKQSHDSVKLTVMKAFQCCGLQRLEFSSSDPLGYPPCKLANLSCCNTPEGQKAACCQGSILPPSRNNSYCPCTKTCWPEIEERLSTAVRVTGATSLFFSVVELLGVWIALRYRHQRNPLLDPNSVL